MHEIIETTPAKATASADAAATHARRIWAAAHLEWRRRFSVRRWFAATLYASLPILLAVAALALRPEVLGQSIGARRVFFAAVFEVLIIRITLFFGCMQIFLGLFQNEQAEQTLHYAFLAPIRRDALALGKYLFGVIAAHALFCASALTAFCLLFAPLTSEDSLAVDARHAFAYLGVVSLACIGYGAVFLLIGTIFRNPNFPIGALFAWEWGNVFLPPLLKRLSVAYYLNSLLPVPLPTEMLAIAADPPPTATSVVSVLLLATFAVGAAVLYVRRMEIRYHAD
jgi:ABC-type transport system involved in multi-copper enzyme maturation permease subunit